MKHKPFSCFIMITALVIIHNSSFAQCELPKPGGSHNMCSASFQTGISNTSNTITITNAGAVPPDGSCSVTLSYYDESVGQCAPQMNCTGTLSSSGTTVNLSLNNCSWLPDLPNTGIFYINIQTGAGVYFYHVRNYSCDYVLPITLSAFNIQKISLNGHDVVKLTWTSDQESNFDRYVIERGSSGEMDLGAVAGTNTSTPHNYEFIDYYPTDGNNFYRLRMVDLDGSIDHSIYKWLTCSGCNQTPPLANCSGISINGPGQLCDPATYTLSAPVYYSTYTWSVDPLSVYYPNWPTPENKPSIYLTPATDGPAYLTVTLSGCTPATRYKTKSINVGALIQASVSNYWVGSSPVPVIQGDNYVTEGQIEVSLDQPWGNPVNVSFVIGDPIPWTWNPNSQKLTLFMTGNNYVAFHLDINTVCGPRTFDFALACTDMLNYYTLSPNPASSTLRLYVDDQKLNKMKLQRSFNQNIQRVIIADKSGNTVYQQKYPANTSSISVNIAALKTDLYTIRIFNGKQWKAMKFMKQ
jgi:hypothetical protein